MSKKLAKKKLFTFKNIFLSGMAVLLIHVISAATLDRVIQYKEVSFRSVKVPPELDGYKIAFIADTHSISESRLESIVTELNKRQPDLLLFGGDTPNNSAVADRTLRILSSVRTTDGFCAAEGNHDNYAALYAAMERYSVHPLRNFGVHVRDLLYVAGLEDMWHGSPDIEAALSDAQQDDFVLLVAHNPDLTMVHDTSRVDLILSGHTHGGHITLFGLWAPALIPLGRITAYGQRFMSGWAKSRDGAPVYVSKGVGAFPNVPRVFARPQVIIITLLSET